MTFDEWLEYGIKNNYCSQPVCETHDGIPLTDTELDLWDSGTDPCATVVRLGTWADWESEAKSLSEFGLGSD